jgi:hypothetical protein
MSFTFQMRLVDGSPADPPTFTSSVPKRGIGDLVRVGAEHRYTITGMSYDEGTGTTTWIVTSAHSLYLPFTFHHNGHAVDGGIRLAGTSDPLSVTADT